jgi:hypothetical protein
MTAPQQQRRKLKGPMVITANRLWDGAVVYRTADDGWSTELATALVVTSAEDAQSVLDAALADENHAVGAYAAPVTQHFDTVIPANLREQIRGHGPTVALPGAGPIRELPDVRL